MPLSIDKKLQHEERIVVVHYACYARQYSKNLVGREAIQELAHPDSVRAARHALTRVEQIDRACIDPGVVRRCSQVFSGRQHLLGKIDDRHADLIVVRRTGKRP